MIRRFGRIALVALSLSTVLAGCSWLGLDDDDDNGSKPETKLPGERIPVLTDDNDVKPDETIANDTVRLPRPWANANWPQSGGYPDHAMQHLQLGDNLKLAWQSNIGSGSDGRVHLLSTPVVDHGRVYTLDARSQVSAFNAKDGSTIWQVDVTPPDAVSPVSSGGIAIGANRIYVASGFAQILALDAASGKEVWRQNMTAPLRAAPTIVGDRIFVVTVDNEVLSLSAQDGSKLWSHTGISDVAGLLGGASPAVDGGMVIAPTNTGEIFALRVESGRLAWSDSLLAIRRADAVSALADIAGLPVIDHGVVFAVSHSGRMAGIDLRTGDQVWDRDIGGEHQPWIAGDFVYVLSNNQEVFCLMKSSGLVRWSQPLQRWTDEEKKSDKIAWAGPVLAGDRLIVTGTNGMALAISPYTGETIGQQELPGKVLLPPVVADRTLYILTDDGDLLAFR